LTKALSNSGKIPEHEEDAGRTSGNIIASAAADPIRPVQEEISVAERRFGVLINGHDDSLDVLVAPASRGAERRTSARALIRGGLSSYHFRGSRISPPTPAERFSFERTGLLLFQPLCTKPIDLVQHPIQQRFGRRGRDACSLELPNLAALAVDLNAHMLDLGPNVIDIRHGSVS
jgi:hypothetical protein